MSIELPLKFKGAPGSPYTRKMLAALRYRRIPYCFLIGDEMVGADMPKPRVSLLPTFYLRNQSGEYEAVIDSTPLIRRFEKEIKGRSIIPNDNVMAFLNYLLEDFGDEWLTKAMFHYRWHFEDDIEQGGNILPRWRNIQAPEETLQKAAELIRERQISRLYVVGSNEVTAAVIESSYKRFLQIMDRLLQKQPFLMGRRPGSADFGIYGQLTQLVGFDPTPMRICLQEAPRVFAWTDVMDDLSGQEPTDDAWLNRDEAKANLNELLSEVGMVYVPFLLANARAIRNGEAEVNTEIDGKAWQQPAFPYQARCLQWILDEFNALDDEEQASVRDILSETGCEALLD